MHFAIHPVNFKRHGSSRSWSDLLFYNLACDNNHKESRRLNGGMKDVFEQTEQAEKREDSTDETR